MTLIMVHFVVRKGELDCSYPFTHRCVTLIQGRKVCARCIISLASVLIDSDFDANHPFWSHDNITYIINWIKGTQSAHGLHIRAITRSSLCLQLPGIVARRHLRYNRASCPTVQQEEPLLPLKPVLPERATFAKVRDAS
jgi:hypothetical protein